MSLTAAPFRHTPFAMLFEMEANSQFVDTIGVCEIALSFVRMCVEKEVR